MSQVADATDIHVCPYATPSKYKGFAHTKKIKYEWLLKSLNVKMNDTFQLPTNDLLLLFNIIFRLSQLLLKILAQPIWMILIWPFNVTQFELSLSINEFLLVLDSNVHVTLLCSFTRYDEFKFAICYSILQGLTVCDFLLVFKCSVRLILLLYDI